MIKVQIKFSLGFSCVDLHKKKREFCVDLIQIIFLITIVYLYKRIRQPDIKFYVYLCINILRDAQKQRKDYCKCILEGNVEILQILARLRGILIRMWISRQKKKYIYIYSFINFDDLCYCFIFSECGYLLNMIFRHGNKILYNFVVQFLFINRI